MRSTHVCIMNSVSDERDYLCVDEWLTDPVTVRALATAIQRGAVDAIVNADSLSSEDLGAILGLKSVPNSFMIRLLTSVGVLDTVECDRLRLSVAFRRAWQYRDLLTAKIDMTLLVGPDWFDGFELLLDDSRGFAAKSRLFRIFDYSKARGTSAEDLAATARWLRYTTALTRYESGAILNRHDFSCYSRMLDIGGNSGEFALQICRRYPRLAAVVCDLPAVCALGEVHVGREAVGARISFHPVISDDIAWPSGFDLVTFKSMLHDWPESSLPVFLSKAYKALRSGGRVMIVERCEESLAGQRFAFGNMPLWMFFPYYRKSRVYTEILTDLGFSRISSVEFLLDSSFHLIVATKE